MKSRRAFSYARFSCAKQADGFSLARQLETAKAYCDRNGLTLDDRTFVDMGVSGFHGSNSLAGDLAVFIDLVRQGRVPKGSVLIVENTDRLSRLPPDEANRIITTIVKAGIDIVTTSPEQVYTAANIDKLSTWLPLQVSNCLAREESVKKSDRLKDAWKRERKALADGVKLSKHGPFWLQLSADRKTWIVKEREAELMRKMFRWCAEGLGVAGISERLHRQYPSGISGRGWQPNNIRKLLRSRQVLGELQVYTGVCAKKGGIKSTRVKHGQPITGYFPAIVSEDDFYKAQQAMDSRRRGGGRSAGLPNLFNGIMYDAADGMRMVLNSDHGKRVLVSSGAIRKMSGSTFRSVSYDVMEAAILSQLAELKLSDVIGKANPGEDEVKLWSGRLAAINHNITQTQQRAATADDPTVFLDLLESYGKQRKSIVENLESAKQNAASPVGDVLGECTSLVSMLAEAKADERDDLRARVKATLRRLVTDIRVLSWRHRHDRHAIVTVNFRGGGVRVYTLLVEPRQKPARWWCRSSAALGFRIGGPVVKMATLTDDFAGRLRRHTKSEDGEWGCCNPRPVPDAVSAEFGEPKKPASLCGCVWKPGRQRPLRCPKCGGREIAPVIGADVTTSEIP